MNAIKTNHPLLQYHITLVKAQCLDMTQDFVQAEIMYQNAYDAAINLKQMKQGFPDEMEIISKIGIDITTSSSAIGLR